MPTTVTLHVEGGTTTPEQIVSFWTQLRTELRWFPGWFDAWRVEMIIRYLAGEFERDKVETNFILGMCIPPATMIHVDVAQAVEGTRRVFLGPVRCNGIPRNDGTPEENGGANFYWHEPESGPREMRMTIYSSTE